MQTIPGIDNAHLAFMAYNDFKEVPVEAVTVDGDTFTFFTKDRKVTVRHARVVSDFTR